MPENSYVTNGSWESEVILLGNDLHEINNVDIAFEDAPPTTEIKLFARSGESQNHLSDYEEVNEQYTFKKESYLQLKVTFISEGLGTEVQEYLFNNAFFKDSLFFNPEELNVKTLYQYPMQTNMHWSEQGTLFESDINKNEFKNIYGMSVVSYG